MESADLQARARGGDWRSAINLARSHDFDSEGGPPLRSEAMTRASLRTFLALLVTISACSDDGDDKATASAGSTSGPTSTSMSTSGPTSTSMSTSGPTSTSEGSGSESSSTTAGATNSTGTTDATSSSATTGGDLPDGTACSGDAECLSGDCYVIPFFGGICGPCNEDADCEGGGCSPPNPFNGTPSSCNMGAAGGGCETDAVCMQGLKCGNVLDLLDLIQLNTCGECTSDAQCMPGLICAPQIKVADFAGVNTCIEPGALPQDAYCLLDGNGNQACMSGVCSSVEIMGVDQIGACGECQTDADCNGNTICTPGEFDLDPVALTGSKCL
jgi:hypothetical protein